MARSMCGWVLLGIGVPASMALCALLPVSASGACFRLTPASCTIYLAAMLDAGLGAWMVWSGTRRSPWAAYRMKRSEWVGALSPGLLTSAAVAAAWLCAGCQWLTFIDSAAQPEKERLELLLVGSLFAAPLVGAIVVLIEWLRGRQRSAPADESQTGTG